MNRRVRGERRETPRILGRQPKLSIATLPESENRPIPRFATSQPTIRNIAAVARWWPALAGGILRVRSRPRCKVDSRLSPGETRRTGSTSHPVLRAGDCRASRASGNTSGSVARFHRSYARPDRVAGSTPRAAAASLTNPGATLQAKTLVEREAVHQEMPAVRRQKICQPLKIPLSLQILIRAAVKLESACE